MLLLGKHGKDDMQVGLVSKLSLPLHTANHVADLFGHGSVYDGMAVVLRVAQAVGVLVKCYTLGWV